MVDTDTDEFTEKNSGGGGVIRPLRDLQRPFWFRSYFCLGLVGNAIAVDQFQVTLGERKVAGFFVEATGGKNSACPNCSHLVLQRPHKT